MTVAADTLALVNINLRRALVDDLIDNDEKSSFF